MINKLFKHIVENGKLSSKISVLNMFGKNDKVFTKKIEVPGDKISLNGCKVKYISLTSSNNEFTDVSVYDVRVNMKNRFGLWVNLYAHSLPSEYLERIVKNLGI